MQRDFFGDILRKSPIIGICMIVGFLLGACYCILVTHRGFEEAGLVEFPYLVWGTFALGGGFLGLIVGVIIDTFLGRFRSEDDAKKKRRRRRS
jgi:hypothetical protein